MLFTSQIGFDVALTNVEATLKQRWNDVVQYWKTVSSMLRNIDLTFFHCWTPTLYHCCATLKIRFRILFHFHRRINVVSTVIQNLETTLIRRWNDGWVVSMKKLILRNILPKTSLTKWNFTNHFQGLY